MFAMTTIARSAAPLLRRLASRAVAFRAGVAGLAAIEFALILPVMATIVFGLSDGTTGVVVKRKMTLLSRSLADLTSRVPTMTTTEMANIFAASAAIMQPYPDGELQMLVTSVNVTKVGETAVGSVSWSCGMRVPEAPSSGMTPEFSAHNLVRRPPGSAVAVPAGYEESQSFLYVETLRPYIPVIGYVLTGPFYMRESTPWPVRNVSRVTGPPSCPAA